MADNNNELKNIIEAALLVDEEDSRARRFLAYSYSALGRDQEAVRLLREALRPGRGRACASCCATARSCCSSPAPPCCKQATRSITVFPR